MSPTKSVYLIYGIRISYTATNFDQVYRLMNLVIPDLIEQYGFDDVWSGFDDEAHQNGYYCLNFTDQNTNESELFICCYFHEHCVEKQADDCKEVILPSATEMNQFQLWLRDNGVDQRPKYYTKLYESY